MKASNVVLTGLMAGVLFFAQEVAAEELDLAGVDKTVTALTELDGYEGVTNSSDTPATLTFALSDTGNTVEIYAGVLSGNLSVVKDNKGTLALSAANTYTGGTVINGGKLRADNVQAFGPVNAELPIQVNSDCNGVSAADANVVAVVFNVADTFAYPINCAAWTDHGAKPAGSTSGGGNTLYNIAASIANVTLNGKITGGDVSFHAGVVDKGLGNVTGCSGFSVKGDVECPGGCVAINTRGGAMAISGKVTAALVSHPTGSNWPSGLSLGSSQNAIGSYDIGRYVSGGGLTCGAENALPGCVIFSSMSAIANASSFLLGGKNQTIDRVLATQPANASLNIPLIGTTSGDAGKHLVASGTSPGSTSPATLTMKATGNATNDWAFSQALSVVWDPQGDYTILNVSRQHIMNGTIAVKGGCFAMDENCTFSNVTAVTVADGAVFSNACAAAGSLKALTTLTLGAGAKAYLPADALKEDAVTLRIDPTAEVIFPDGTESVSFGDIYVGEKCLAAGSYRSTPGDWSRVLPQVKGTAMIVNFNKSGTVDVEVATWDAGGADTLLHTKENWVGDETPQFDGLPVEATFAAGTEATVDRKTLVSSLTFAAPGDFDLKATGEGALRLSGGLFAADDVTTAHRYEIATPLMLDVSQSWDFGTNANVTLSGPLSTPEAVDVTTTVSSYQPLRFVGSGESSYAGVWSFPNVRHPAGSAKEHYAPCVFATGVNPFGGAGATVKMAGGLQSGNIRNEAALPVFNTELSNALILSNATVGATLEFSHSASEDRYGAEIVAPDRTTNVVNGVVSNVRVIKVGARSKLVFNGPVSIHANDIGTDQSLCFKFDWRGGNDAEGTKQSVVEFNGCVTFPTGSKAAANMNQMVYATYCFNAPSNVMDSVGSGSKSYFTVSTGAEYAFADGRTAFNFRVGGPSFLQLNGHSQHIGPIDAGDSTTSIESTSEATLRINQTKDATFKGAFQPTVNVVKEGTGTLGLSKSKAFAGKLRLAEGAFAPATGALSDTTEVTFAGGTLTLPEGETSVFKAYYVDGDGVTQPLPRGTYCKGDDSPIGDALEGTGALRVRKSDLPTGIVILVR